MFTFAVPDTQHADRSREYLKNNWIDFEEEAVMNRPTSFALQEEKLRKVIRKIIRQ